MGSVQAKEMPRKFSEPPKLSSNVDNKTNEEPIRAPKNIFQGTGRLQARVDKINVEGLGRTKDDIVLEAINSLFKATRFEEVLIDTHEVRKRLESLGCFKRIGVYIDTSSGPEATPDGLEVTFQVSELKRLTGGINTSVGSNEGSLVISGSLPNLLGRGERIQAEYAYSNRKTCNGSLDFVKPLRGKSNAFFTTSIFQRSFEMPWSGYKQIDRGTLFDVSFTSAPLVRHNVQWETAWRDLSVLSRTTAFEIREMAGPSLKGSLRHILSVDRRDQIIFPRTGTWFKLVTEYAGIGGNVNFFKNEALFQANLPLSEDVVFQASFQGGLLKSLGSKPVTVCDNFFLGGPLSLRGFETRGVGPTISRNSLGGSAYWAGALHLFTPLPFKPGAGGIGEHFRTHFFVNAGNIGNFEFTDDYNHNLEVLTQNMRVAFGVGIAMRIAEIARLELNYCVPYKFLDRTDTINKGVQFGLGVHFL